MLHTPAWWTMPEPFSLQPDVLAALNTQYDVLRELGRGAMGTVYLAQERLLQRQVAVKILPAAASLDSDARARFLREARTAARLTHPNIVPLYSFMEAGTSLLYIMGYVEGESLRQMLAREGRLQAAVARRIIDDVAEALGYAHSQGVIHRDVKPDNILIEASTGRAFLADFGVAREAAGGDTLTHTGMLVGTPHYMSPEQAAGAVVDARSDLYSLGIIGYEMLSGQLPFTGTTVREVLTQRMTREALSVSTLMPETPEDLVVAVGRALRREPAERWIDAAALRASLQLDSERMPTLPDELESLPSLGSKMVAIHAALGLATGVLYVWDGDPQWISLGLTMPVISFPIVLSTFLYTGRKQGYGWRRILKLFFYAPERWAYWWPKSLRRPGNVWDRLPRDVRGFRTAVLAGALVFFGMLVPAFALVLLLGITGQTYRSETMVKSLMPLFVGPLALAMGASYTAMAWTLVWKKRFGITLTQANKLLVEPVVSAFWKRPEIAPLLRDPEPIRPAVPKTPAALAQAISDAMSRLPPQVREAIADATHLAREAAAHASQINRELAELAHELNPVERRKLEQRLAELNASPDGARANLRELVSVQIRMLDDLEKRRLLLAETHERIEGGLRQMWHQISVLRGGQLDVKLDEAEITSRIRALCSDLNLHQQAATEVTQMLERTQLAPETP